MEILDEIRTEQDRVVFLKSVAEQLLVKARVKLNLKNIYQANGFAVRELLKVATLLHEAHRNANPSSVEESGETAPHFEVGPGHKFADVKTNRAISADITKFGASLYQLLESHADAKEVTARALGKNHDVENTQRQLQRMVQDAADQAEQMERMLSNLSQDESNLQLKIDKKKTELDRHQKRLQSLQTVRPAFMDEYERLEGDLSAQYALYVQNWRNLSYLEAELDAINSQEADKIAESDRQLRLMQRRLREEELKILRGQAKVDERALDEALFTGDGAGGGGVRAMKRPGGAANRNRRGGNLEQESAVYGAMETPMEDDEDAEEGSSADEGLGEENSDEDGSQVEFTQRGGGEGRLMGEGGDDSEDAFSSEDDADLLEDDDGEDDGDF